MKFENRTAPVTLVPSCAKDACAGPDEVIEPVEHGSEYVYVPDQVPVKFWAARGEARKTKTASEAR